MPELGLIGANSLAYPNHFSLPTAWFEDKKEEWKIINKYCGKIFQAQSQFSPYNVVGWHGNYTPFKYNLENFNVVGSISYDHPDPSIFTVLTVKSAMEGYKFHNVGHPRLILLCFLLFGLSNNTLPSPLTITGTVCLSLWEIYVEIMTPKEQGLRQDVHPYTQV